MSELRQRRGDQSSNSTGCASCGNEMADDAVFCMKCGTKRGENRKDVGTTVAKVAPAGADGGSEANREELITQITDMVTKLQAPPKPGLSHEAKKWKDILKDDPNSLESMRGLGLAYAADHHWDKVANVMIRGLKRTNEFKDPEKSYDYLYTLCQASLKVKKYKQAMMVLQELKPPSEGTFVEYEVVQCQVYCANGDSQRGIKAFHQAIKGNDFTEACSVWAMCLTYLKQAEAYDICKQAVEALAQKEEDGEQAQKKLAFLESMVELRESAKAETQAKPAWWTMAKWFGLLYLIFVAACLYHLEEKSLASLKIGK